MKNSRFLALNGRFFRKLWLKTKIRQLYEDSKFFNEDPSKL
jgi:hypothetical protein